MPVNARLTAEDANKPRLSKVLLERKDFCYRASISISTLKRLIGEGEVETRKIGRKVLIPTHQLDRLLKARSVKTRSA